MEVRFSLADLFEDTFGYKTHAFEPKVEDVPSKLGRKQRKEYGRVGNSPYYSEDAITGREYYMPVEVNVGAELAQAFGVQDQYGAYTGRWELPHPIVSVTSRKTIVETALTERRGTVKELINIMDYDITIRGLIVGKDNEFPEEQIETLRSLYELNAAVRISSVVTDIFLLRPDRDGRDTVVIKSLDFPEVRGVKGVRGYVLNMVSDAPFNLVDIG